MRDFGDQYLLVVEVHFEELRFRYEKEKFDHSFN
jgi:hypothetical protein